MFFTRLTPGSEPEFILFSTAHFIAVLFSMFLLLYFLYKLPKLKTSKYEPFVRYFIVIYLLFSSLYKQYYLLKWNVPWYAHLPNATCGLAIVTASLMFITKKRIYFVITFYWGWGAFLALLFPNMLEGPTKYYFYQFYLRHFLIVLSSFYMIKVFDKKIFKSDYKTYVSITLPIALIGLFLSLLINDLDNLNMMYMTEPPVKNIILDYVYSFGHAIYAFFWITVALLLGYLWQLPFYKRNV